MYTSMAPVQFTTYFDNYNLHIILSSQLVRRATVRLICVQCVHEKRKKVHYANGHKEIPKR